MKPRPILLLLFVGCTVGTEPLDRPAFSTSAETPALLLGAGDIARCGADGTPSTTNKSRETSDLLLARPGIPVFLAGDNAYYDGTLTQYRNCYHPTWGRVKSRTLFPTPGNHEYHTVNAAGQTVQAAGAPGYFDYFNGAGADAGVAGKRREGYYARDYGGARIYGLNSELSSSARAAMVKWVKADLLANPRACQIAIIHRPFFTTAVGSGHTGSTYLRPLVDALVAGGVELLISGHNHHYERFARMRGDGTRDPRGIRQYVVGTGGTGTPATVPSVRAPGNEAFGNVHGVMELAIYRDRISTRFIPVAGRSYADGVTTRCDGQPDVVGVPAIRLSVSGQKRADGRAYMALNWTGATGSTVKVYRNGAMVTVQANDGYYTNSQAYSRPVTYTYKVCDASACSPEVRVSIP